MKQTRREFVRTLFIATAAGTAVPARLFAGGKTPPPISPDKFNFIIFGDWGRNGQPHQVDVARQMAVTAKKTTPRFIISAGDNFYENGVASATDPQWQTSFENVYHDPALQIPWQVILGNHDYKGNTEAQLEYTRSSHRWNLPARYYTQTHRLNDTTVADFFYLDTSPMISAYKGQGKLGEHIASQDVPKQLEWLKQSLASSQAKWKIVVGHHPIYSGGEHGDSGDLAETVLPLLHEYKVQAWFNGHDHDLQHLVAGDLNLFCSGAGSNVRSTRKTIHTRFAEARPGFTTVSLDSDRMLVHMIDSSGTLLYHTVVPINPA